MQKLMNVKEVAEYLGVAVPTIYGWTHRNFIPHHKLSNLVKFRKEKIDEWVAQTSEKKKASFTREELISKAFS